MGSPKKAAGSPPIMENEHVKELLSIMEANNLPAAKDLLAVLRQVGAMERQLDAAVNELQSMRRELETMREESHPIKTALQNAVKTLEKNIAAMRERLDELKTNIIDGCKNAVTAFKEKGLSALRNIADFFKIRPGLEAMQDALNKCIRQDERAVAKIEAVSAEYHEAGRHIKNIGRAMVGKEAIQEAKAPGKLAAAIAAPYRAERACLVAMRRCTNAAIDAVDRLENRERNVNEHERQFMCSSTRLRSKPPIMETINKLNEQIAQAKKDAPVMVRPRPVARDGR